MSLSLIDPLETAKEVRYLEFWTAKQVGKEPTLRAVVKEGDDVRIDLAHNKMVDVELFG